MKPQQTEEWVIRLLTSASESDGRESAIYAAGKAIGWDYPRIEKLVRSLEERGRVVAFLDDKNRLVPRWIWRRG